MVMSPLDVLEVVQLGGVGHSDITPGRETEGNRGWTLNYTLIIHIKVLKLTVHTLSWIKGTNILYQGLVYNKT